MQLNKLINAEKKEFDRSYVKFLQSHLSKEVLSKAMIYGSINGGKRIRPFLVSTFAKISKIKKKIIEEYLLLSNLSTHIL